MCKLCSPCSGIAAGHGGKHQTSDKSDACTKSIGGDSIGAKAEILIKRIQAMQGTVNAMQEMCVGDVEDGKERTEKQLRCFNLVALARSYIAVLDARLQFVKSVISERKERTVLGSSASGSGSSVSGSGSSALETMEERHEAVKRSLKPASSEGKGDDGGDGGDGGGEGEGNQLGATAVASTAEAEDVGPSLYCRSLVCGNREFPRSPMPDWSDVSSVASGKKCGCSYRGTCVQLLNSEEYAARIELFNRCTGNYAQFLRAIGNVDTADAFDKWISED
jgi:hypothetical protein